MTDLLQESVSSNKNITHNFITVIAITFFASIIVASVLVSPSVDHSIEALQQTNSHAEANLSAELLEQYIQDRVQVLRDIAKYPIVKTSVMGTGISQADLYDFIDSINLAGNREDLAVLTISAIAIYDRHETPRKYNPNDAWFVRLLEGTSDQEVNLINTGKTSFIQIAVPINLGGFPEGVLVTEIKTNLDEIFKKLLSNSNRSIILIKNGTRISTSNNMNPDETLIITEHLADSNIELKYQISKPQLKDEKIGAILKIMLSVLASMISAFAILYFTGQKTLLNPYKKLQASQINLRIAKEMAEQNAEQARQTAAKLTLEQEALKVSEARFQLAAEGSNDGIWEWNAETNKTYFSPRLRELLGYEGDDTINLPNNGSVLNEKYHPEDISIHRAAFLDHIKYSKPYDIEFRLLHKDGSYRFFRSRGKALRDKNGKAIRIAGSMTDINDTIVQQKALENARMEAENANQAKSEFLASMSHEIRTPMNGIIGMLSILEKGIIDPEQRRQLNIAKLSSEYLLNIINDILDFSKIDARKLTLENIDFNPIKLISDFTDGMALRAAEKGLELILDLRETPGSFAKGDPSRIRQVLTNLVGNAIKFTERGEITLKASITSIDSQYCQLSCSIKDTGIGITEDQKENLFKPFTQADSTTTRKYGGTGLGLTICKHLCELMGGSIWVESTLDAGSEFHFNLRLQKSERNTINMPNISAYDIRILVVDNNKNNCSVLSGQLQQWGAHVSEANSADQAMNLLQQAVQTSHPYNLALFDLEMPGTDGVALAQEIRKSAAFRDLKIALMITQPQPGDARKYADIGIQAYFPKPMTISDLLSVISMLVNDEEVINSAQALLAQHVINEFSLSEEIVNSLNGLKLLVVEDNEINREVIGLILEDYEIQLIFAEHGKEALKCLLENSTEPLFDLVLMDCQMPTMDGFAATRAIRNGQAGDHYRSVPIIAMTANAMVGDREQCIEAGMNDYLSKPIDTTLLARTLAHWASHTGNPAALKNRFNTEHAINEPAWDLNTALKRVRGREDRLTTLLHMFEKSTPELLHKIKDAIDNHDFENIKAHAHALKGTSGNLAFMQLYKMCTLLEQAPESASPSDLMLLFDKIKNSYNDIKKLIMNFLTTQEKI